MTRRPPGGWAAERARTLLPFVRPLLESDDTAAAAANWLRMYRDAQAGTAGYRPATVTAPPQRIPRLIWQTVGTDAELAVNRTPGMAVWWELNPDYDYYLGSSDAAYSPVSPPGPCQLLPRGVQ